MAFKVGDKVTVNDKTYRGHVPRSITTVVSISARILKTKDNSRWHPLRGTMLDFNGREQKSSRIFLHQEGDEQKIQRIQWMKKANPLVSGVPSFEDVVHLISDDDLRTLGEIGERLSLAQERSMSDEEKEE